jgi:hypothetical protein
MKMLASIKAPWPEGKAAKSLGDDREFIAFSYFPDNLRGKALQKSLCLLDGTLPDHLKQDPFFVL